MPLRPLRVLHFLSGRIESVNPLPSLTQEGPGGLNSGGPTAAGTSRRLRSQGPHRHAQGTLSVLPFIFN